jgi:hydroxymethylpyrimidine/phosphomethylpyrimidine kinase
MSVITALTAQNTREVRAVHEVPPAMVAAQLDAVMEDIGADAIKIGMLASAPIVEAVAGRLRFWLKRAAVPVVLDPVMVAKSGDSLLHDDAVEAILAELLPLCTVVTPNIPELERMTGLPAADEEDRVRAAAELARRGSAVLAKGGHAPGSKVVDILVERGGRGQTRRFSHPRVETRSSHGTGCTLSSAIAARLALGDDLPLAVQGAIGYLEGALMAAYPLGTGHGPVNHLYDLFPEGSDQR